MSTSKKTTDAPDLNPFHPFIVMVEALIIALIIAGLGTMAFGHTYYRLIGLSVFALGAFCASFGHRSLSPSNPRIGGVVTIFDQIIDFGGEPVVVGGRVWIIPFIMGIIEVKMDNQDYAIPMTILSGGKHPISLKGEVTLTTRPSTSDIRDYIQSGNSEDKVAKQIDGPVVEETKDVAKLMTPIEISQGGKNISAELEKRIKGDLFQHGKLGLELVFVRANFPLPDDLEKKLRAAASEEFERTAEKDDSRTITQIAREMQREDAIQYLPKFDGKSIEDLNGSEITEVDSEISKKGGLLETGKVLPFEHYRATAERRRLIRDGKVTKIEGAGANFSLVTNK